jgi:hypothetical protein
MRRQLHCLLLTAALVAPQAGWAASSRDYAGPCANETTAAGTPQFISVDVRTRPTDARVINLTAPGRFRLGISCVYTEFKVTRLGDGQVVFQHRCNKHGFGWYDAANLPAGSYRATAEAKRISFEGYTPVQGHGTMDTYAYVGNGGAYQPVNCSPPGEPLRPDSHAGVCTAHHPVQLPPGGPQPGHRHAHLRPGHREGVPHDAIGWQSRGLRRTGSAAMGIQHGWSTG